MKKTGEKLRQYTKDRGIRLRWVAGKMGITPTAIYYKVGGSSPITLEDSIKIKKLCRMNMDEYNDIFSGESWFGLVE